jgi:hypothetical protein
MFGDLFNKRDQDKTNKGVTDTTLYDMRNFEDKRNGYERYAGQ